MVAVTLGELAIINAYLPDTSQGNGLYLQELEKLLGIKKRLMREGCKH